MIFARHPHIKAILFDLDGTLIDSESVHYSCWNELLEPYGAKIGIEDYVANFQGVSITRNAERLRSVYGIQLGVEELIRGREALYQIRLSRGEIKLMPFASEILQACGRAQVPTGLVTSSARNEADVILKMTGFDQYFKESVTRTEVTNFKPHPEPYLTAATLMGVHAAQCLVVEDTFSGVSSAKAAGMLCFGVQADLVEAEKLRGIADRLFANLQEVSQFLEI